MYDTSINQSTLSPNVQSIGRLTKHQYTSYENELYGALFQADNCLHAALLYPTSSGELILFAIRKGFSIVDDARYWIEKKFDWYVNGSGKESYSVFTLEVEYRPDANWGATKEKYDSEEIIAELESPVDLDSPPTPNVSTTAKRGRIVRPVFPIEYEIEDVQTEIENWQVDNNPRITCSHSAVIKSGSRAHQVATCLEIVNEHTGELHHYAIEIHNVHKYKNQGWKYKETYRIDDLDLLGSLYDFLTLVRQGQLDKINSKQYVVYEDDFRLLNGIRKADSGVINSIVQDPQVYESIGGEMLMKLLELGLKGNTSIDLVNRLSGLDIAALKELNAIAGVSQLKSVLAIWNDNQGNNDEEFWQKTLSEHSWIISQLFSIPLVLLAGKAYMGGKWIDNRGGNITDFVFQNNLTTNVILIEIKTPETLLIGGKYRQTYSVTPELSGSINQILNYREKLSREYANIIVNNPDKPRFENFNPRSLLVIGNFRKEISSNSGKVEALELFRSNSTGVDIITFDELFDKVEILLRLIEGV